MVWFVVVVTLLALEVMGKAQVYYDFPSQYMPANPSVHPRLYIKNDLPRLKLLWANDSNVATQLFKKDIASLMSDTAATDDWRADTGWPAAALGLAWLLSGDASYGTKACNLFIPYFTGAATGDEFTDVYYSLAYDWLYNHPCMTSSVKSSLRNKLINWSSGTVTDEANNPWTAHDSDRNIATTMGHLIGGLAILGDDSTNAALLLKRGWTGWKYGINQNDDLPDMPVSNLFGLTLQTGIPCPGWDYGMMSDFHMAQVLFYVLDELGVIDAEFSSLKVWWAKSLESFMRNVDPANTHYHWIGDQQNDNFFVNGGVYTFGFVANCIYLAERYGYVTEAARGRYFLDNLRQTPWGISEGDTMLFFMRISDPTQARINPATSMPRYAIGMGATESMGVASFRSAWTATTNPADSNQVTWGTFYGISSYRLDHQHNSAGSFWIWRNGDYLLTDPINYGGNELGDIWMSLSIPNPAVPNENENYNDQGPVVYFNEAPAFIERGRTEEQPSSSDLLYVMLNADTNYNVPDDQWAECTGTCRQPVGNFTRHFLYDGGDYAIIVDRVEMARANVSAVRFRTSNGVTPPSEVSADTFSIPSDRGNYRTLVRVLSPTVPTWQVLSEKTMFPKVANWQIDNSMLGYQVRGTFPLSFRHSVVTALNFAKSGSSQLSSATYVSSSDSFGGCASQTCLIIGSNNVALRSNVQYTAQGLSANTRHLVADMDPSICFKVTGSVDGSLASGVPVRASDNTILFTSISSGSQQFTIQPDSGCTTTATPTTLHPVNAPTKATSAPVLSHAPTMAPTRAPTTHAPTLHSTLKPTAFPTRRRRRKHRG